MEFNIPDWVWALISILVGHWLTILTIIIWDKIYDKE